MYKIYYMYYFPGRDDNTETNMRVSTINVNNKILSDTVPVVDPDTKPPERESDPEDGTETGGGRRARSREKHASGIGEKRVEKRIGRHDSKK